MTRLWALAITGLAGAALGVVATSIILGEWGAPGTSGYARYEFANRVAAVGLLLAAAAPVALRVALVARSWPGATLAGLTAVAVVIAAAATAAEFWLFTEAPYQGAGSEGRLVSFGVFGVAALAVVVLATLTGVRLLAGRRSRSGPAVGVAAAGPVGLAVGYVTGTIFGPLAVVAAAVAIGALLIGGRRIDAPADGVSG